MKTKESLTDWFPLLEGKLSQENLDLIRESNSNPKDAADFILSRHLISPQEFLPFLSEYYKIPVVDLDRFDPELKVLSLLPHQFIRRFLILPLFQIEDQLYVAVSDPEDLSVQDNIRRLTGLAVEPIFASKSAIDSSINRYLFSSEQSAKRFEEIAAAEEKREPEERADVHIEDEDVPVIKMLNLIFSQAVRLAASDIHLEPLADSVLLRYRVDGVLREMPPPPLQMHRPLISRIKILSGLDIAERRLPQDGQTRVRIDDREWDFRISIIPNLYGEGAVIRILDTGDTVRGLEDLGFSSQLIGPYKKLLRKPYGIILVTGPTGSGKTTSLYSSLRHIFTLEKKIITLEDPIESPIRGITQLQINSDIGFSFAHGLRSVLRHDPDIIMLGEIRDLESAEIAIRCSLTGHLVFSTLHTNDSPSAITRLVDMGIDPSLLLTSLIAVLAQRLLKRLCSNCKAEISLTPSQISSLELENLSPDVKFYSPKGCASCNQIGYKGRVAIGELLEISPEMRRFSADEITLSKIRDLAMQQNFTPLRKSALDLLHGGITSVEEVLAVTEG